MTTATDNVTGTSGPTHPGWWHDPRAWWRVVCGLVGLGGVLRLAQYLANRSYWHDEAMLVANVYDKTATELLGRLDFTQAAPPLFLLAERAMVMALGPTEWATRLVPLMMGLVSLVLVARVGWLILPPVAAAVAVALFAVSDRLIWHAAEAKQYAGDVAAALLLTWLALEGRNRWSAAARLLRVSVAAALLVWLSHTAAFVFGGISLALLPEMARARRWASYVALNALVVVSFVLLYAVSVRLQQNPAFYAYWHDALADYDRWWAIPTWAVGRLLKLVDYPYENGAALLLPLTIVGGIRLWSDGRRDVLGILAWPVAMTFLAALARRYPFDGSRVTLFLAPAVFLLASAGLVPAWAWLSKRVGRWAVALPLALIGLGAVPAAYHLAVPRTRAHVRPAVTFVREHFQPGDVIVTDPAKLAEMLVYWRDGAPEAPIVGEVPTTDVPERFWIVMSFSPGRRERQLAGWIERAEAVADQALAHEGHAASALLFERHDVGDAAPAPATRP